MTYSYSFDEEHYTGELDTREDAIAAAKADADGRNVFWTGKAEYVDVKELLPDMWWITDNMVDRLYDYVGEYGDTYLDDIKPDKAKEMTPDLHAAILAVFEKHGVDPVPKAYSVVDVQEYIIVEGAE